MKKMLLVFNPNSGKAQIAGYLCEIVQILSEKYEVVIYPTRARMDGYEKIKQCDGRFDIIVCSGGDGTLNETVAAVMEHQISKPFIGYIPSGTTNDFAKSLKVSGDMIKAAKDIINGNAMGCDIGKFNGRYYNYVAAFGAFTEVSYSTPQQVKNILGHPAYLLEALKSIPFIKPVHMTIEVNGETVEGDFIYGMISNTTSVGGIKNISGRDVQLDDGLFECTFIRKIEEIADFNNLITAVINRDFSNKGIYHTKTKHIDIKSQERVPWVLDGEYGGEHNEVSIDIIANAVNIIVPALREEVLDGVH